LAFIEALKIKILNVLFKNMGLGSGIPDSKPIFLRA
jgi:hypothetical protein